jgi:Uma2 family endonuclease
MDGELVREAAPSFEHGDAQLGVGSEIRHHFRGSGPPGGDGGWWIATEVDVVYSDTNCFRHDVAGWRKSRVTTRPSGPRVSLAPDWVCEVLSSNRRGDLVVKRRVLHEKAVPYYWTVELDAPLLTVLRYHPDGYLILAAVVAGERARLEPFQAVELEVARLFGDLDWDH